MSNEFTSFELRHLDRIETSVPVLGPVKYTVKSENWLTKKLVMFLIKRGIIKESLLDMEIKTTFIEPSDKALLDKIMGAITDSNIDIEKARFVIGADDFHSLEFNEAFNYTAGPFYQMDGQRRTIRGVPVQVVPWMKGWAVIPNDLT